MAASVAQIWRHPIKGIGAEALSETRITRNLPLPLVRAWALLQVGGEAGTGWRSCSNFLRGAKGPSLMAITARSETAEDGAVKITLAHPDRPEISIDPDRDGGALMDWVRPIYPEERPAPAALIKAPPQGMSDANFPSISILNRASLRALGQKLGQNLDERRFRGNLWLEGLAPWEEFDLVGKTLRIGMGEEAVEIEVIEPIGRCRATEANPETGRKDAHVLAGLSNGWGHTQFGVYATARSNGCIRSGDPVEIL